MRRALFVAILSLILSLLALFIFFIPYKLFPASYPGTHVSFKTLMLGGFNIDTPQRAKKAATDGVQVVFKYGQPPSARESLGQALQSLHMKVVDGFISSNLYYYECHRTKTVKPPPPGEGQYCYKDDYPYLTDENVLLATITAHLKQVKDNPLIVGYWVLDDWAPWDSGSAQQILVKIHMLIKQYTPTRPAICGFGGSLDRWDDWVAANFSPRGCDMVGTYIYGPSFPDTTPKPSPDAYDWSMSSILPSIFASLQRRGWDITREPLIGIGQAFGGPRVDVHGYWLVPTANDIATQSRSYCEHGASGITYYGWADSTFGPTTLTPMNSAEIETGIRNGIAACKQYLSNNP